MFQTEIFWLWTKTALKNYKRIRQRQFCNDEISIETLKVYMNPYFNLVHAHMCGLENNMKLLK
jgi:hypothetical protein